MHVNHQTDIGFRMIEKINKFFVNQKINDIFVRCNVQISIYIIQSSVQK